MDKVTTIVLILIAAAIIFAVAVYLDQNYNQGEYSQWLEPGPPPEEPEPEPDLEQVRAETRDAIEVVREIVHGGRRAGLADQEREAMMQQLAGLKDKYGKYGSGQEAFAQVAREVAELALAARDQDRWRLVSACVDAHDLLGMESFTIDRLNERAEKNLGRPKVAVRGFLEDQEKDDVYVFLELTNRQTGEVEKIVAREKEEIGDLRIVRISGKNDKVVLEYLPIEGLFFEVEPFKEPSLKEKRRWRQQKEKQQQERQQQGQQQQPPATEG